MKKPSLSLLLFSALKMMFMRTGPAPDSLRAMARNHLDAMRLESAELYAKQILPETIQHLTPENRGYYDWQLKKDLGRKAPPDFKISSAPLNPARKLFLEDYLIYPARPTHVAKVRFRDGKKNVTLFWQVLERTGSWYIVIPEPVSPGP